MAKNLIQGLLLTLIPTTLALSLSAQNATVAALVYGFPLVAFQKVVTNAVSLTGPGANNFLHARVLQSSSESTVVAPNADTLYSTLTYDLSQEDVVITVPDVPQDQFHLLAYYDPFGDNYALTGSDNLNQAGQYRLRQTPFGGQTGVDTSNNGTYEAYINSPTAYGILLIRWLVNATNLDVIHSYQDQTSAKNVSRPERSQLFNIPSLLEVITKINETAVQASTPPSPAQQVLGLLAAYAPYNLPETSSQVPVVGSTVNATVDAILTAAGISNGTYMPAPSVDLDAANTTGTAAVAASIGVPGAVQRLSNGWAMLSPPLTGDFGIHYGIWAYIAKEGYLQLKAPNAVYLTFTTSSSASSSGSPLNNSNTQLLPADSSFLYTFVGGRPPLQSTGFWSLTAYTAEGFLIPNDLGVFSRGDRSNLTYAEGTAIYPVPQSVNSSSGGEQFQILVQQADVPPPANWTNNWLPGPAGEGIMQLLMRFYDAENGIISGNYEMPVVTLVSSITNGTGSSGNGSSGSGESSPSGAGRAEAVGPLLLCGIVAVALWWMA